MVSLLIQLPVSPSKYTTRLLQCRLPNTNNPQTKVTLHPRYLHLSNSGYTTTGSQTTTSSILHRSPLLQSIQKVYETTKHTRRPNQSLNLLVLSQPPSKRSSCERKRGMVEENNAVKGPFAVFIEIRIIRQAVKMHS